MKQLLFTVLGCVVLFSCTKTDKEWQPFETIELGKITPIGFAFIADNIWIADGDHNQLVEVNQKGEIQNTVVGFERPMHIDSKDGVLYIPEYGSDQIIKYGNGKRALLSLSDSLDAPAGVAVFNQEIAIADFYNHRIVYFDGQKWFSFGKEGKGKGELYYPTDVQILTDKIVVADAYNNRIQIFDKSGNSLRIIGEEQKMNAATGLYADDNGIWVTDFENDRVLVYQHDGTLSQIIEKGIDKPTDILVRNQHLYIANYKGRNILKLKKQ
jgi:DNA-binding beta-propeller fold protein YncE